MRPSHEQCASQLLCGTKRTLRRLETYIERALRELLEDDVDSRRFDCSFRKLSGVRMEIINTVQSVLKQQEGEVLLLQTEMVDLESVTKTQARRALFSDAQGLLAEQRETVRCFSEPARDDSNPQHAPPLEVELESIQKRKSTRRPSPWAKRSCRCSSARNQGVSYLWDLVLIGLVSTYSGP